MIYRTDDAKAIQEGRQLIIGNLDKKVTEKELWDTFDMFGIIERCRLDRDKDTGESKEVGYVTVSKLIKV